MNPAAATTATSSTRVNGVTTFVCFTSRAISASARSADHDSSCSALGTMRSTAVVGASLVVMVRPPWCTRSLVPQRVDGTQRRGAVGGIDAEEQARDDRDAERQEHRVRLDDGLHVHEVE